MTHKAHKKSRNVDPAESQRFVDTAREIGADESPEAFDHEFRRITGKKLPPKLPKKPHK